MKKIEDARFSVYPEEEIQQLLVADTLNIPIFILS